MADTGGIAALLKALNDTPGLGGGLKPGSVSRPTGLNRPSASGSASGVTGTASSSASHRPIVRAAARPSSPIQMPKILGAEGQGFDPKAPRGTYLNMVI